MEVRAQSRVLVSLLSSGLRVPRVHQEHGHLRRVPAMGQPARCLPDPAPSQPAFSSWPQSFPAHHPLCSPPPRTARIGLDPSVPSPLTFLPSLPQQEGVAPHPDAPGGRWLPTGILPGACAPRQLPSPDA